MEACSTSLREQLQAAEVTFGPCPCDVCDLLAASLQRSLDVVLCSQQAQFQALFQYAQGAASLWDSHMAALDDTQRQHQVGGVEAIPDPFLFPAVTVIIIFLLHSLLSPSLPLSTSLPLSLTPFPPSLLLSPPLSLPLSHSFLSSPLVSVKGCFGKEENKP